MDSEAPSAGWHPLLIDADPDYNLDLRVRQRGTAKHVADTDIIVAETAMKLPASDRRARFVADEIMKFRESHRLFGEAPFEPVNPPSEEPESTP